VVGSLSHLSLTSLFERGLHNYNGTIIETNTHSNNQKKPKQSRFTKKCLDIVEGGAVDDTKL